VAFAPESTELLAVSVLAVVALLGLWAAIARRI
jgi:hypothetical protein